MLTWSLLPYLLLLLCAAVIAGGAALYAWRLRTEPGASCLTGVSAACFIWVAADTGWLVSADADAKLFWGRVAYLGIVSVPVVWLTFAANYGGYHRVSRLALALLFIVPLITLALVWTNDYHGLVWASTQWTTVNGIPHIELQYGRWFWVHAVYSYAVLTVATGLLVFRVFTTAGLAVRQGALIVAAPLIPWAANAIYLLGRSPEPSFDPTPVGLALALVPLLWARLRYSLFDVALGLAPIARDTIVESMPDGVIALDRRDHIVYLNTAARRLIDIDDGPGAPERRRRPLPRGLAEAIRKAEHSAAGLVEIGLGAGAAQRELELVVSPLRDRAGNDVGRLLSLRDVTARRQSDRALHASESRYRRLLDTAQEGVWLTDVTGRLTYVNDSMAQMIGYSRSDLLGRSLTEFVEADEVEPLHRALVGADTQAARQRDVRFRRRDGSVLWTIVSTNPSLDPDGGVVGTLGMVTDITSRKRAELLEEEQRSLAYELHDGLAQLVAGAHQHLQAYAYQHPPESPQAKHDLDRVLDIARNAVRETRRVIAGLRPTVLDDFGLATAVRLQVETMREEGWDVEYENELGDYRPSPSAEMALYRVAQEALANVRKHAETGRVRVALARRESVVMLEVQDWGQGFDLPTVIEGRQLGEGLGLRGMRHRVSALGGQLLIGTRAGEGTHIVAEIPLASEPVTEPDGRRL